MANPLLYDFLQFRPFYTSEIRDDPVDLNSQSEIVLIIPIYPCFTALHELFVSKLSISNF
jgi:hypothetical protein